MNEVYEFLKKAEVYYLATTEGAQPRVRPFGTVDLFEGKIYIQTGLVKDIAKQMMANPKVEISAMAEGKWIRLAAEAVLDKNVAAQEHMLAAYPNLQAMYKPGDGNTAVFYLKTPPQRSAPSRSPKKSLNFDKNRRQGKSCRLSFMESFKEEIEKSFIFYDRSREG